jgi:hypothetical protein
VFPALAAASDEIGRYRFEAFMPKADDPRLPVELRAHPSRSSSLPSELLATDRAVEIEWVGREGSDLRGYRLTATIDGGPLSGLAARWTVAPGSGDPVSGPRLYRLHLPLPVDGRLRVHAALEAVRLDGSSVLLAVRHATPGRTAGDQWLSGPGWQQPLPSKSGRVALLSSAGPTLPPFREYALPDLGFERARAFGWTASSADAARPGRPRGPPAQAAC